MDFLKRFDAQLYELYLAIQTQMDLNPLLAVSKAQLFVQKLYEKLPERQDEFMDTFSEELAWLMGLSGTVGFDDALKAHEALYRMANWTALNSETPQPGMVTEAVVGKIIEEKVLPVICGTIKELDTIMSALDDAEKKLARYENRLAYVEAELAQGKLLTRGNWVLKTNPRTKK